jgi:hypothetical protein
MLLRGSGATKATVCGFGLSTVESMAGKAPGVFSWPMSAACYTIANHYTGIGEI